MTFSIDNPEGGFPLGKYVWEKPSGEQGLKVLIVVYGNQNAIKIDSVFYGKCTV